LARRRVRGRDRPVVQVGESCCAGPAQPDRQREYRDGSHLGTTTVLRLADVQIRQARFDVAGGPGAELLGAGAGELLDHDCSFVVPSREASSARARERWTLTVPSAQPSVAATSMTGRSRA